MSQVASIPSPAQVPSPSGVNPAPERVYALGARRSSGASISTKNTLMRLGVAEVVLGSFCVIMGAMILGHETSHVSCFSYGLFGFNAYEDGTTTGEGMWCGVWIILAGGFAVGAGKKRSLACLVSAHLALAIVGAVFSGALFSYGCYMAVTAREQKKFFIAVMSLISIASFASMILQVVSACYCCCSGADNGCGGCCGQSDEESTEQMLYYVNPAPREESKQGGGTALANQMGNQVVMAQQQMQQLMMTSQQPIFLSQPIR